MNLFQVGQPVQVQHQKPWQPGDTIKLRGIVESFDGYRLVVDRRFQNPGQPYDGLPASQKRGDYGTIELLRDGWVSRRRYLRANGELIGELYNIQTPTRFLADMALYVDLEVDVAYVPEGPEKVFIQDERELEAGVRWGFVPKELAGIATGLAGELAGRLRRWDPASEPEWDVRPDEAEAAAALATLAQRWPGVLKGTSPKGS
jgi:hypothetical protein